MREHIDFNVWAARAIHNENCFFIFSWAKNPEFEFFKLAASALNVDNTDI